VNEGMGEAASTAKNIIPPAHAWQKSGLNNGKRANTINPATQPPKCPQCASERVWKDGMRYLRSNGQPSQRWLCRACGYRFSELKVKVNVAGKQNENFHSRSYLAKASVSNGNFFSEKSLNDLALPRSEKLASHEVTVIGKGLNALCSYNSRRRVCASESEAKNLATVETRQNQAAGATTPEQADIQGKIIEVAWQLKKEGYSPATIYLYPKYLKMLVKRGANLYDPGSVKDVIAKQEKWEPRSKAMAVTAYGFFASINNITWQPPKYQYSRKLPFIPLESEIDALIAACGRKTATALQVAKETGARIGEVLRIKWIDLDLEHNTLIINTPEKTSNSRMFKISAKLTAILNILPKTSEKIFGDTSCGNLRYNFYRQRKRIASKLQNPRLLNVHFHTLRHWKATMEYHKTKDLLHVMKILGHRNIQSTLMYTQLINFESDEYHSATTTTIDEAKKLIEAGFEYVCTYENTMMFRKRK